jgi:uracil-DNA glycosylase
VGFSVDEVLVRVAPGWREFLEHELSKAYMRDLVVFLQEEHQGGKVVLPPKEFVLRALATVDVPSVRVVVLGQDPYHGLGQANGMSFAVHAGQPVPPSLRNIFREMEQDLGLKGPFDTTLEGWARQGVLLLNTVLTVVQDQPMSHRGRGWEEFTAAVVEHVNRSCPSVVFIFWGAAAAAHRGRVDATRHHVVQSAHPSPLSAHRGFFGSRPFSRTNDFLTSRGYAPIQWGVPLQTQATLGALVKRAAADDGLCPRA